MKHPRQIFGGLGNRMFQMAYIYAQVRRGLIPDVYLQDERHFAEYKDDIKKWYGNNVKPMPWVSLHIRRGDYVGNDFYVDLTKTDYYQSAVKEFPHSDFAVFCADRQGDDTKDQAWCKTFLDTFIPGRYHLANGPDEIYDFNVMAGCDGHIMANSSFSWWASYVGGGKTVAPKQWFTDGVERISIPSEWLRL